MVVTAASVQDRAGAKQVREVRRPKVSRLRRIWADGASAGALVDWGWWRRPRRKGRVGITERSDTAQGREVLPKRWIVERTLGWFNRYRRLSTDDELLPETSEAVIYVVMLPLLIRRLAR